MFEPTEDQIMLRESVSRWLDRNWSAEDRMRADAARRSALWSAMVQELGLTALAEAGSAGDRGIGDIVVIQEALGRALALPGFLPTVVFLPALLEQVGDTHRLGQVAAGEVLASLALSERGLRRGGRAVATSISPDGRLSGCKVLVAGAPQGTHLLVSAMEPGHSAYSLFFVPAQAEGLSRRDFAMIDGQPASDLLFEAVPVGSDARIGAAGQGPALIAVAEDLANVALCAEGLGVMDALVERTVAYLKERRQFGQALADFQVLRHRVADMVVQCEHARSLVMMAEAMDPGAADFSAGISAMKVQCCNAMRFVSHSAVQLHGGMGITDELMIGHYFKRAMVLMQTFGTGEEHLTRFEQLLG